MKITLRIVGVLAVVVIALVLFIQLTYNVDFTEEYPVDEDLVLEITPERVAHGEYLAYGPAQCASCHVRLEDLEAIDRGEKRPMIGGFELPSHLLLYELRISHPTKKPELVGCRMASSIA